jgi:hypothetical protein
MVWRGVEWVRRGGGMGENFEECGGRETVVPLGVLAELFGSEGASGCVLGERILRNYECAEKDAFALAGRVVVVRANAFNTLGGCLFKLLSEDGGVDS